MRSIFTTSSGSTELEYFVKPAMSAKSTVAFSKMSVNVSVFCSACVNFSRIWVRRNNYMRGEKVREDGVLLLLLVFELLAALVVFDQNEFLMERAVESKKRDGDRV